MQIMKKLKRDFRSCCFLDGNNASFGIFYFAIIKDVFVQMYPWKCVYGHSLLDDLIRLYSAIGENLEQKYIILEKGGSIDLSGSSLKRPKLAAVYKTSYGLVKLYSSRSR
jgi:hypothetical protein